MRTGDATASSFTKKDPLKIPLKELLYKITRKLRITFLSCSYSLIFNSRFVTPWGRLIKSLKANESPPLYKFIYAYWMHNNFNVLAKRMLQNFPLSTRNPFRFWLAMVTTRTRGRAKFGTLLITSQYRNLNSNWYLLRWTLGFVMSKRQNGEGHVLDDVTLWNYFIDDNWWMIKLEVEMDLLDISNGVTALTPSYFDRNMISYQKWSGNQISQESEVDSLWHQNWI